jgi:hypothetical protein
MKKKIGWLLLAAVILLAWLIPSPLESRDRVNVGEPTRSYDAPAAVIEPTPQPPAQTVKNDGLEAFLEQYRSQQTQPPEPNVKPTPAPTPAEQTYILNTNTHKFHYPWCSSVDQMKEQNKREYTGDRADIIEMGYAPCQRCHP